MSAPTKAEPRFGRGARVRIAEPGLSPWIGVVTTQKWSAKTGWWIEVRRDDGTGTYAMTEDVPELVAPASGEETE